MSENLQKTVKVRMRGVPIGSGTSHQTVEQLLEKSIRYPNMRFDLLDENEELVRECAKKTKRFKNFTISKMIQDTNIKRIEYLTGAISRGEYIKFMKDISDSGLDISSLLPDEFKMFYETLKIVQGKLVSANIESGLLEDLIDAPISKIGFKDYASHNLVTYLVTEDNNLYGAGVTYAGATGLPKDTQTFVKIDHPLINGNVDRIMASLNITRSNNKALLLLIFTLDNKLYYIGGNVGNRLGKISEKGIPQNTPKEVINLPFEVSDIDKIYTSYQNVVMVLKNGDSYIAGDNTYGQRGVKIDNNDRFNQIYLSEDGDPVKILDFQGNTPNYFMLTDTNDVYFTGDNKYKGMGVGNVTTVFNNWTPVSDYCPHLKNNARSLASLSNIMGIIDMEDNLYVSYGDTYGSTGWGNTTFYEWRKHSIPALDNNVKEVNFGTSTYLLTKDDQLYITGFGTGYTKWGLASLDSENTKIEYVRNMLGGSVAIFKTINGDFFQYYSNPYNGNRSFIKLCNDKDVGEIVFVSYIDSSVDGQKFFFLTEYDELYFYTPDGLISTDIDFEKVIFSADTINSETLVAKHLKNAIIKNAKITNATIKFGDKLYTNCNIEGGELEGSFFDETGIIVTNIKDELDHDNLEISNAKLINFKFANLNINNCTVI